VFVICDGLLGVFSSVLFSVMISSVVFIVMISIALFFSDVHFLSFTRH